MENVSPKEYNFLTYIFLMFSKSIEIICFIKIYYSFNIYEDLMVMWISMAPQNLAATIIMKHFVSTGFSLLPQVGAKVT